MLDCEGSFNSVEPIRSLSEMEPSGVSVEVTKSCTNKDHCQSVEHSPRTIDTFGALAENYQDLWSSCRELSRAGSRLKHAAFFDGLKSKVGHIMAKASALRININLVPTVPS